MGAVGIMECTNSILTWANAFAPIAVSIKLCLLEIILWVNYLLFCLFDVFFFIFGHFMTAILTGSTDSLRKIRVSNRTDTELEATLDVT